MTFNEAEHIWQDIYINGNWGSYTSAQRMMAVEIHNGIAPASDKPLENVSWGWYISDRD